MITENPLYILHQKRRRAIIPKIISFIGLSFIFYLGILLNLALLKLRASDESIVRIISLIVLLAIIAVGTYLAIYHSHIAFKFYKDCIMQGKKSIPYIQIKNTTPKKDIWDKMFKTYNIQLNEKFVLRHIPNETPIEPYLKQMIDYKKKSTPSFQYSEDDK